MRNNLIFLRASASLALFGVLPSSLQAVALTNPAEAATEISSEFATGTPTWFTKLPTDVQSYFITAAGSAVPTTLAITGTGGSLYSSNSTTTGKFLNSTITSTAAATSSGAATSGASGTAASTGASSSSSTGGASLPTQVIGAGIAGALGVFGMLAL
jgi:hypothetical protein